jgi:hypothetical protein
MNKLIICALLAIISFLGVSCTTETKNYDGPAQVAFVNSTLSFNVTSTTATITIPVQLIADVAQPDIATTIAVNTATTCATAVTVPTTATIPAGSFHVDLVIPVTYANLTTSNKLVLDLTSDTKVAQNYKTITVTLVKK